MKEYLDSIVEFLEENLGDNYIWIAGGAVALVLVIIIAIAAGSKKHKTENTEQQREFFLEGEYDTMIREEARAKREDAAAAPEPEQPEKPEKPEQPEQPEVVEYTAEEQVALKEELQQVQININIERGQVHIGYEEDGRLSCVIEDMIKEAEETVDEAGPVEPAPESGHEILADQGIVLEKINLVKTAPAKKFGPDNFNTGRSGRVFTEEELREQIKQ